MSLWTLDYAILISPFGILVSLLEHPCWHGCEGLPTKAMAKCYVRIERLEELGHELRRPEADLLRDKIYELRVGLQGINYRILYFFSGDSIAVLAHGIIKEKEVPDKQIERAVERRNKFEKNPIKHTYDSGDENEQE